MNCFGEIFRRPIRSGFLLGLTPNRTKTFIAYWNVPNRQDIFFSLDSEDNLVVSGSKITPFSPISRLGATTLISYGSSVSELTKKYQNGGDFFAVSSSLSPKAETVHTAILKLCDSSFSYNLYTAQYSQHNGNLIKNSQNFFEILNPISGMGKLFWEGFLIPVDIAIPNDLKELEDILWNQLSKRRRSALYICEIDCNTGSYGIRILQNNKSKR